ncbi:DinB family protein [Lentibacillus sp. Marseille-P4043]|uniref:DinB family protein n=1 Tax=Lentibacillus sp. Marseille-P4043 TaxID=2040293 RepID=UPI000D0B4822|nr:DinB family protein [Lentibacillus sp. Marseille-P4043]
MQPNDQARETILTEVNGISDENLNKKPDEKSWSIKQVLEHLFLMEGAIVKTIADQLENGEDVDTDQKPIEATVDRSKKVEAPDFADPSADYATLDEMKLKLEASHQGLIQLVEKADVDKLERKAFPHPVFGQMSLKQWIPFIGWHEKRHILQIQEVKEALGLT